MEATDVDVLSSARVNEPWFSPRDAEGKIIGRRRCPEIPENFQWHQEPPGKAKSKRFEKPPEVPSTEPRTTATRPELHHPEKANDTPWEHRPQQPQTQTSFPLRRFTNLATMTRDEGVEIERVKKAKLTNTTKKRALTTDKPDTSAATVDNDSSRPDPPATEQPPPKRQRLRGKQPLRASQVLAPLAYTQTEDVQELNNIELENFLLHDFGLDEGSRWQATCIEAGAGGDCFFHAVGSILQRMVFDPQSEQEALHVLQYFQHADFRQGKQHLVQKMRAMVAAKIYDMSPEEFLNFVLTLVGTEQAGAWPDRWSPEILLRDEGFEVLRHATMVLAVENAGDHVANLVVKCKQIGDAEHVSIIDDGIAKLSSLKDRLRSILATCGNTHWATPMDVVFLGEACSLGFVIFGNRKQGNGRWLYGFNPRRGDFPYWLSLYCISNIHFKVLQLSHMETRTARSHWAIESLPAAIRRQYDVCNSNNRVGSADGFGIS